MGAAASRVRVLSAYGPVNQVGAVSNQTPNAKEWIRSGTAPYANASASGIKKCITNPAADPQELYVPLTLILQVLIICCGSLRYI